MIFEAASGKVLIKTVGKGIVEFWYEW
jgi:hypothetical protein